MDKRVDEILESNMCRMCNNNCENNYKCSLFTEARSQLHALLIDKLGDKLILDGIDVDSLVYQKAKGYNELHDKQTATINRLFGKEGE